MQLSDDDSRSITKLEERKRKEKKMANTSCFCLPRQELWMKRGRRDGVVGRVMFRGQSWSRVTETSAGLSPSQWAIYIRGVPWLSISPSSFLVSSQKL